MDGNGPTLYSSCPAGGIAPLASREIAPGEPCGLRCPHPGGEIAQLLIHRCHPHPGRKIPRLAHVWPEPQTRSVIAFQSPAINSGFGLKSTRAGRGLAHRAHPEWAQKQPPFHTSKLGIWNRGHQRRMPRLERASSLEGILALWTPEREQPERRRPESSAAVHATEPQVARLLKTVDFALCRFSQPDGLLGSAAGAVAELRRPSVAAPRGARGCPTGAATVVVVDLSLSPEPPARRVSRCL